VKNSLKGALFSGLIFPGLGQIVLKRYRRGAIIVTAVLVAMAVFVVKAVAISLMIVEEIQSESGTVDMSDISAAATQAAASSTYTALNLLLVFVILCWVSGTIDAYRIGRKMDLG
jgi:uncharacterized membrane protein